MFTGIIIGTAKIAKIIKKDKFQEQIIKMPIEWVKELKTGDSVAQNGCCLTVTKINNDLVHFDVIEETLLKTNLGQLQQDSLINIELAAKVGDYIGGHLISGHIIGTAIITNVSKTGNNHKTTIKYPSHIGKYIFNKGYISVDGISLTISDHNRAENTFCINLIPETLKRTTISAKKTNDIVNIEIDSQTQAIVETTEEVLKLRNTVK